jgi:hypothetical protein
LLLCLESPLLFYRITHGLSLILSSHHSTFRFSLQSPCMTLLVIYTVFLKL